jgi:hypothetical protein
MHNLFPLGVAVIGSYQRRATGRHPESALEREPRRNGWPNFSDYRTGLRKFCEAAGYAHAWVQELQPVPQALALIGRDPIPSSIVQPARRWESRAETARQHSPRSDISVTQCEKKRPADKLPNSNKDCAVRYACHALPHFIQTVGFRPANSANNPTGNKQIATKITQVG